MKILSVDTSLRSCSVALLSDGVLTAQAEEKTPSSQAEKLLPIINTMLAENSLNYTDLDVLAVAIGPGSFTGIRIGMAAIQGIGIATDLPIIGVSTLETIAYQAQDGVIFSVINAMRGQLYIQKFSKKGELVEELGKPSLVDFDELQNLVEENTNIISNCTEILAEILQVSGTAAIPHASSVVLIAENKFKAGYNKKLSPLYIRKPDAKKAA